MAHRRRDHRHRRLAGPGRSFGARDDVHIDGDRRIGDIRRPEIVEVRLLHLAVLQRDGAVRHQLRQAEAEPALNLAFDRQRIHRQAAIDRNGRAMDPRPLVDDRNVDRAGDGRIVILGTRDSSRVSPRKRVSPRALFLQQGECGALLAGTAGSSSVGRYALGWFLGRTASSSMTVSITNELGVWRPDRHASTGTFTTGWWAETWKFGME